MRIGENEHKRSLSDQLETLKELHAAMIKERTDKAVNAYSQYIGFLIGWYNGDEEAMNIITGLSERENKKAIEAGKR